MTMKLPITIVSAMAIIGNLFFVDSLLLFLLLLLWSFRCFLFFLTEKRRDVGSSNFWAFKIFGSSRYLMFSHVIFLTLLHIPDFTFIILITGTQNCSDVNCNVKIRCFVEVIIVHIKSIYTLNSLSGHWTFQVFQIQFFHFVSYQLFISELWWTDENQNTCIKVTYKTYIHNPIIEHWRFWNL